MRNLIIFGTILLLTACSTGNAKKEALLTGKILNSKEPIVLLSISGRIDTIALNEEGSFSHTLLMDKATKTYLQSDRKRVILWMEPGTNLEVTFDINEPETTRLFSGDTESESEYSNVIDKFNREINQTSRDSYKLEPVEFREKVTSDQLKKEEMLNNLVSEKPGISQIFINMEKTAYQFSAISFLMNYEGAHKYYAETDEVKLPSDWYSFMDNIDLNNESYLDIPEAVNVISTIIGKKINESSKLADDAGDAEQLGEQFKWIKDNISNPAVAEHFMNSYITAIVDYKGPSGIENYIDIYNQSAVNAEKKADLAVKVAEWEPIMPGMDAPIFNLPDLEGNIVSLEDFSGKYVYIDFWATWCGPCKIEIPVLSQLAKDYAGKNIEIISISVDRDKQAWIDMITEDKPNWLQLHDSINFNDEYLVKFIPTFVLIDRNGKIIDSRAPRPSSGKVLTDLLNSLEGI